MACLQNCVCIYERASLSCGEKCQSFKTIIQKQEWETFLVAKWQMTFPLLVSAKSTYIFSHSVDILIEVVVRAFMKLSVS